MKTRVVEFIGRIQDAGAETLVKDYALLLDKEKYEVIILCYFSRKNSSIYRTLKDNNIQVVQMYGNFPLLGRAISRMFKSFNSILLNINLKKLKPDVLHIHLEQLDIVYKARRALDGIKLIYTCHNLPKTLIGEDLPKEQFAAEYLVKNNNLQMVALHDDMAKEINQRFNINNTVVIKNGIDFKKFKNIKESKEEIRNKLNIKNDAYVIGNIGRLTYQKNPEYTINVFNEIYKINKNAYLLMIGSGKEKNNIEKLIEEYNIKDNVLMLSNRNDIPQLLKAMDVFLFPTRYEGLGIVLIEAQVVDIPCVVSENVPHEAYQSNLITELSLEDSYQKWAEACLNPKPNIDYYGNIEDYDMNKEIMKLEELYKKK